MNDEFPADGINLVECRLNRLDEQAVDQAADVLSHVDLETIEPEEKEYSAFVQRVLAANAPGHIGDDDPGSRK